VVDSRERPLTVGKTTDAGERTGGDVFWLNWPGSVDAENHKLGNGRIADGESETDGGSIPPSSTKHNSALLTFAP